MKDFNYVTDNEFATNDFADAMRATEVLIKNGYVVMISREEKLYIVNYVWSPSHSNRNDVVFNERGALCDYLYNNIDNAEDE